MSSPNVPRSVRELRRLRQTDCTAFEANDESAAQFAPAVVSPSRHRIHVEFSEEERHYYWSRMTQLIRIQKWWKCLHARATVKRSSEVRKYTILRGFEDECALLIQCAWRRHKRNLK